MACITFLVFVPWKRGHKYWTQVSPYIFYVVLLMNYLIVPFANIALCLTLMVDPNFDLKIQITESYVLFFFGLCWMRVFEFFFGIRRTVLVDARTYLESKKEYENESPEALEDEFSKMMQMKNEEDISGNARANTIKLIINKPERYEDIERAYGQGNPRLGDTLEMDDSIYSLGFLSQINDQIMNEEFDMIRD